MNNYDGGPAFPVDELHDGQGVIVRYAESGMSLRDYFAIRTDLDLENVSALSLAVFLGIKVPDDGASAPEWMQWYMDAEALYRYRKAGAMLKARTTML